MLSKCYACRAKAKRPKLTGASSYHDAHKAVLDTPITELDDALQLLVS